MTKADLIEEVAKASGLSKKDTEAAIEAAVESMKKAIKKNGSFRYPGFGTFTVKSRKARIGINPQTKAKIKIKASKTVGFKPAQAFKGKL
jgi:DNA-binding protein HU-beta